MEDNVQQLRSMAGDASMGGGRVTLPPLSPIPGQLVRPEAPRFQPASLPNQIGPGGYGRHMEIGVMDFIDPRRF